MQQRVKKGGATGETTSLTAPDSGSESGDAPPVLQVARESLWYHSAFLICAEVMGMGLLGLPHAMAQLGWVVGLSAAVIFGITAVYSMLLLSRIKNELLPSAESYADIALATVGPMFGAFTRVAVLLSWASLLPYFLLACAKSMATAAPSAPLQLWHWTVLAAALLVGPLQLRTLHQISWLSLASSVAVLVAVVILVATLLRGAATAGGAGGNGSSATSLHSHTMWPPPGSHFLDSFGYFSSFVFAYNGHSVVLEIMREMHEPRTFPYAVLSANGLMITVYTATSALGYAALGRDVAGFLPDSMEAGAAKSAVGCLLTLHTAVAYMVVAQPLHRALHGFLFPLTVEQASSAEPKAAAHWLLISASQLAISFVLAAAVPFFDDLQSLLGALTCAPIVYGFPALFFVRAKALHGLPVPMADGFLCALFLGVLTPLFMVVGTFVAVRSIIADWQAT